MEYWIAGSEAARKFQCDVKVNIALVYIWKVIGGFDAKGNYIRLY
jgi:hypothetical protein